MPDNATAAVLPGVMRETFERAERDFAHLKPTVLSRSPWVMAFDEFLTPEEVAAVLVHGEGRYVRALPTTASHPVGHHPYTRRACDDTWQVRALDGLWRAEGRRVHTA